MKPIGSLFLFAISTRKARAMTGTGVIAHIFVINFLHSAYDKLYDKTIYKATPHRSLMAHLLA